MLYKFLILSMASLICTTIITTTSNLEIVNGLSLSRLPITDNDSDFNFQTPQELVPSDFNFTERQLPLFSSNAHLIAKELIELDETEIKDYPLTDLPVDDIKAVFTILDSGNLSKVLLNIPADQLKEIQNKLSSEEFDNILKRLPPNETEYIIKEENITTQ